MSTRAELAHACEQAALFYHAKAGQEQRMAATFGRSPLEGRTIGSAPEWMKWRQRAQDLVIAFQWLQSETPPEVERADHARVVEALQTTAFDMLMVEGSPEFHQLGGRIDEAVLAVINMPRRGMAHADLHRSNRRDSRGQITPRPQIIRHPPLEEVRAARVPRGLPPETEVPMPHEADQVRDEEEI